jgi:enamine deaminase RidA (YjgF/YER057c/UK114 family)
MTADDTAVDLRAAQLKTERRALQAAARPLLRQRRRQRGALPQLLVDRPHQNACVRVFSGSPFEDRHGFCRAIRAGDRVLVSGTAPIWPDGTVDPEPRAQADRCLEIIVDALRELRASPAEVVRTRVFLTTPTAVEPTMEAHRAVFGDHPPVSTMVYVAGLLDERWVVEIEAEAQSGG